jgi:NAD+ kinase
VKRIGLFGKLSRPNVASILAAHAESLARRHKVETFDFDGQLPPAPPLDLAIIFGGDGTILRAARYLAPLEVPAFGINLGKFGFLAGCVETECPALVDAALQGRIKPIVRMMLSCNTTPGGADEMTALNDIVVTASVPAQMIGIELSINGSAVSSFQGDGLIVASATGSTGYNLSSGGPIVTPEADVMILTALAPHTLAIRPMVISGGDVVELKVSARRSDVTVTADGQVARTVKSGEVVRVSRARFAFSLYEGPNWNFYRVVRGKLRWGEEPNYAKDSH